MGGFFAWTGVQCPKVRGRSFSFWHSKHLNKSCGCFFVMPLRKPESMDECVYFTQRSLDNGKGEFSGEIMAWVFRGVCPKCGKAKMGKPRDSRGKVKMRASEYVCPVCGYSVEKQAYEDSLVAFAEYKCPHCGSDGEAKAPFKRRNIEGVQTLRFSCVKCSGNLDVTKKMKEKKRSSASAAD